MFYHFLTFISRYLHIIPFYCYFLLFCFYLLYVFFFVFFCFRFFVFVSHPDVTQSPELDKTKQQATADTADKSSCTGRT